MQDSDKVPNHLGGGNANLALRKLRLIHGLTQVEASKMLGIDNNNLSRIERGDTSEATAQKYLILLSRLLSETEQTETSRELADALKRIADLEETVKMLKMIILK